MNKEEPDLWLWVTDASGEFSVKSSYKCLANRDEDPLDGVFQQLWQSKALSITLSTSWRVLLDRLSTRTNLIRGGVEVTSPNCVMCQASKESAHHLFLECFVAQRVWYQCLRWIGVLFVQHTDMKCHFENFHLSFLTTKQNQVWKGMWTAIAKGIWEQRNDFIFKQWEPDAKKVLYLAQMKSWLWIKYRVRSFNYTFSDWILNLVPYIECYL